MHSRQSPATNVPCSGVYYLRTSARGAKAALAAAASGLRWTLLTACGCLTAAIVCVIYIVCGVKTALRRSAAELADSAQQVAAAASQLSSTSQLLAQGASEQ